MKSRQSVKRFNTERWRGHLVSAMRAVTRAGTSWTETVAVGWRLAGPNTESMMVRMPSAATATGRSSG
jgi:hypothetical protein